MPRPDIYDLADFARAFNAARPPERRHTVPWIPSLAKHHPNGELSGRLLGMLCIFVNTVYDLIDKGDVTIEQASRATGLPSQTATALFVLALEFEFFVDGGSAPGSQTREVSDDEVSKADQAAWWAAREAEAEGKRRPDYLHVRELPGGWRLFLEDQGYGQLRLGIGRGDGQLADEWVFSDRDAGWRAALGWNGHGDPLGWYRNPPTGRRRPDGTPASEIIQW